MLNEGREGSGGGAGSRAQERLRTGGGTEERHNQVVWAIDIPSRGVGRL